MLQDLPSFLWFCSRASELLEACCLSLISEAWANIGCFCGEPEVKPGEKLLARTVVTVISTTIEQSNKRFLVLKLICIFFVSGRAALEKGFLVEGWPDCRFAGRLIVTIVRSTETILALVDVTLNELQSNFNTRNLSASSGVGCSSLASSFHRCHLDAANLPSDLTRTNSIECRLKKWKQNLPNETMK